MSEPETVGFYARILDGREVWRVKSDGSPTRRRITGALKLGEQLFVPTIGGWALAKVTSCGDGEATAEDEHTIYPLHIAKDERKCWACSVTLVKRAVTGVIW